MTVLTRRDLVTLLLKASATATVAAPLAAAQSAQTQPAIQVQDLVAANHVLAQQGVLDGYGHVSVRDENAPNLYLLSRSMAPALVTTEDIQPYDFESNPIAQAPRGSFVERFIHGEIYKVRPDVKAIVHSHAPSLIPFGVTGVPLKPIYHMTAFVGEGVPVFEIRSARGNDPKMLMLVHSPARGRALAQILGTKPAALMRGHGAVIVGSSLPQAVGRSVYLAMNATLQTQAMTLGGTIKYLDADESRQSLPDDYERTWELWKSQAAAGNCPAPK